MSRISRQRKLTAVLIVVVVVGVAGWLAGAGGSWTEDQLLSATEPGETDYFGVSIATDGSTALIGSHYDDEGSFGNAGSVCVFVRSGALWSQTDRLVASDYINSGFFGASVSMSGDSAVFGSYGRDVKKGAAYVFTESGGTWTEQQKLTATDGANFDEFGKSVDVDGDTVIIGAPKNDHDLLTEPGAAYVFTRSGTVWTLEQKLTADVPGTEDWFGFQVAINGDTAVVGAIEYEANPPYRTGSVYVFTRTGSSWSQVQKLNGSGGADDRYFGGYLDLEGPTLVVGSTGTDHSGIINAGAAYVFTESGGVWTEQQQLTAADASLEDAFGVVAIAADAILVGALNADLYGLGNAGSAYLFVEAGGTWFERQKLVPGIPEEGARLGASVALTAEVALASAYLADVGAVSDAGAICSYDWAGQLFADGFESGGVTAWAASSGR